MVIRGYQRSSISGYQAQPQQPAAQVRHHDVKESLAGADLAPVQANKQWQLYAHQATERSVHAILKSELVSMRRLHNLMPFVYVFAGHEGRTTAAR
jgi:hypothetical protein